MRNVFISFLGTGNYIPIRYSSNLENLNGDIPELRFIQEAVLNELSQTFKSTDKAYIFLTSGAMKNWDDGEHFNRDSNQKEFEEGLCTRLKNLNLNFKFEKIDINNGESPDDLWSIFNSVYDCLEEKDIVYFDITHAFRSLPMLNMSLIQYAKALKNIRVGGILYGAFEAKKTIEGTDFAPIWDLTSFSDIQDWAIGANNFFNLGNVEGILNISENEMKKNQLNYGEFFQKFKLFVIALSELSLSYSTARGNDIIERKYINKAVKAIDEFIKTIKNIPSYIPLINILKKIKETIQGYSNGDVFNLYIAIEWCLKSRQIQPAITLLQEGFISIILSKINIDINDKLNRNTVNGYLNMPQKEKFKFNLDNGNKAKQEEIIKKLDEFDNIREIRKKFSSFTSTIRNDINHASFGRSSLKPNEYENKTNEFFEFVKETFPCC